MKKRAFMQKDGIKLNSVCTYTHKRGFTLAEVLITLGIIGIVASMTLPSLITKNQNKENVVRYRKALTTLTNGYQLLMAQDGVTHIWDTQMYKCRANMNLVGPKGDEIKCIDSELKKVFKGDFTHITSSNSHGYPRSEMKMLNGKSANIIQAFAFGFYNLSLLDGAIVVPVFPIPGSCPSDSDYCGNAPTTGLIDVNGPKKPNQIGRDIFFFQVNPTGIHRPYGQDKWDNKSSKNDYCGDENLDQNGYGCGARIAHDGWEMKY